MKTTRTFSTFGQWIFLFVAFFLFSCNAPTKEPDNGGQAAAQTPKNEVIQEEVVPEEIQEPTKAAAPIVCNTIKAHAYTDAEPVAHVEYNVNDRVVDSLNKIIPLYDTSLYNQMAVSYFTSLSQKLHGRAFFTPNADSLLNSIIEILSTRINDGTDIVFLIDKTGSMADDIEKVQKSMDIILNYLEKFDNVKVGIAEYGDKNWHYDFWYNSLDLSYDINKMKTFLKEYETIGNPDTPESVNDAIVKTIEEMSWTPGNKRLLLVIGDAPSQDSTMSDYTLEQVVDKCDSMNVKFNLYPIILGLSPAQRALPKVFVKQSFMKAYPNPVDVNLNVELTIDGPFSYEINDMNGRYLKGGTLTNKNETIDLTELPNGNYLFQVYDQSVKTYNTKMIMVQHN
ncbi:MAG: VWA domain-containing protein [Bacteroidetes bacterium]|nr:VWA domain-containing protein [Bacteroidota bacterium]